MKLKTVNTRHFKRIKAEGEDIKITKKTTFNSKVRLIEELETFEKIRNGYTEAFFKKC